MPDIGGAQIGILYQFDGTSWVEADIENVDNKAY
jgi:hypothetical protein